MVRMYCIRVILTWKQKEFELAETLFSLKHFNNYDIIYKLMHILWKRYFELCRFHRWDLWLRNKKYSTCSNNVRVIIWWHNKELAAASVVYLSRTSQSAQVALEVGIWKTADNDKQLITGRKCNERGKSRRQSVGGSKRQIACMVHNERARLCVCELTPTDVRPDMIPV